MNATTIKCPRCKNVFEISQALREEVEEKVSVSIKADYQKREEELRRKIGEEAKKRAQKEVALDIKDKEDEVSDLRETNRKLIAQLTELNKTIRELKQKDEERELKYQERFNQSLDKAKEEVVKSEAEKHNLEKKELEKRLSDTEKKLEEAQRKVKQGSGQLRGEVLELDLEDLLKGEFPRDEIGEVGKGIKGADVRQVVLSPRGFNCGVILWESKRQKNWSDVWLLKLKSDLRAEGANIPVIVTEVLPAEIKNGIGEKEGVWICSPGFTIPLARLLRTRLLEVAYQKVVSSNRAQKSDQIYSYVTSHEFRQQIEAIVEVYKDAKDQIDTERRAFEKQWKQREAQLQRLLESTASVYGKMQGHAGSAMPQIKSLELLQIESGEE